MLTPEFAPRRVSVWISEVEQKLISSEGNTVQDPLMGDTRRETWKFEFRSSNYAPKRAYILVCIIVMGP